MLERDDGRRLRGSDRVVEPVRGGVRIESELRRISRGPVFVYALLVRDGAVRRDRNSSLATRTDLVRETSDDRADAVPESRSDDVAADAKSDSPPHPRSFDDAAVASSRDGSAHADSDAGPDEDSVDVAPHSAADSIALARSRVLLPDARAVVVAAHAKPDAITLRFAGDGLPEPNAELDALDFGTDEITLRNAGDVVSEPNAELDALDFVADEITLRLPRDVVSEPNAEFDSLDVGPDERRSELGSRSDPASDGDDRSVARPDPPFAFAVPPLEKSRGAIPVRVGFGRPRHGRRATVRIRRNRARSGAVRAGRTSSVRPRDRIPRLRLLLRKLRETMRLRLAVSLRLVRRPEQTVREGRRNHVRSVRAAHGRSVGVRGVSTLQNPGRVPATRIRRGSGRSLLGRSVRESRVSSVLVEPRMRAEPGEAGIQRRKIGRIREFLLRAHVVSEQGRLVARDVL